MATLNFTLTTPDGKLFQDEVDQVTLATSEGQITILPNHIPLVSVLVPGEAIIKKKNREVPLVIYGGFVEVRPKNTVVVLGDAGERAEQIDLEISELARQKAQQLMREKFNTADYEDAALALEREIARVHVARKHRARKYNTLEQEPEEHRVV
ncbi:MAG: ATP synthase F1 subunit epsilon [Candidatus Kerfeldbacteria bacterium RIFCSPHIGHO2_02_FULL_42_14]|uniref:ATP synthase epsilon chain n=2 Tax=Bacteria TaxID=2 RepID=A0A1F4RND6_UNCSA|nr:MAG: ATP synthase F1 subunit epsilon [candidate division WOR-1 bacterium RIFCSPLOWO2_12_FULL_45_9]OGY78578.1 MAG: ATP synthase F1 subunit epsilon [Candidatus Kerfeldbacteria bacterium RIFCSPHIGHO2_02_FULL_42_14]OGY80840.1 MAG: ATP synthase F1 subunit epsilon [Candidatus Kerfeldbacteria bacterium RIFCSPHIGHO2_12_FULL_42_13]